MVEGSGFLMRGPLHLSRGEFLKVFFFKDGTGTYHYQKSIDESISC